jgi:hypothetical protein
MQAIWNTATVTTFTLFSKYVLAQGNLALHFLGQRSILVRAFNINRMLSIILRYPMLLKFCILWSFSSTAFVDSFTELRQVTISHIVTVLLSAWHNSLPTGRIFMKFASFYLWDNVEIRVYGKVRHTTDEIIIQRMRFACCITKARDTQS